MIEATVTKTLNELEADYRRISVRADDATSSRVSAKTTFYEAKAQMRAALDDYNAALAVETGLRQEQEALALQVAEARAQATATQTTAATTVSGDKRGRRGSR